VARARLPRADAGPLSTGLTPAERVRPAPAPAAPVALYVHIPFCVSLCPYCDFVVYAGSVARGPAARVGAFVGALLAELDLRADAADAAFGTGREPLRTVYLGGGTPTLLPAGSVSAILDRVRLRFGVARDAEVTIEANPGPDERGDMRALVAAGVTRLSLGAQAMDPGLLRRLGRRHRPADVADAVGEARAAGTASVSLDLLYDVPGQTGASWAATLDAALALGPDHVSAYALTLDDPDEEGLTGPLGDHLPTTAGARRWRVAVTREQSDDRAAGQYRLAAERLGAAGYRGYEISNWGRPGHESRHNLVYWQRQPYEAVGPGAHAFDGITRRWNAAQLHAYLAALAPAGDAGPSLPPGGSGVVSASDAAAEAVILALRLDTGLAIGAAEAGPLAPHLAWALESGLLERFDGTGERVRLTLRGRLLSNEVFVRLV